MYVHSENFLFHNFSIPLPASIFQLGLNNPAWTSENTKITLSQLEINFQSLNTMSNKAKRMKN